MKFLIILSFVWMCKKDVNLAHDGVIYYSWCVQHTNWNLVVFTEMSGVIEMDLLPLQSPFPDEKRIFKYEARTIYFFLRNCGVCIFRDCVCWVETRRLLIRSSGVGVNACAFFESINYKLSLRANKIQITLIQPRSFSFPFETVVECLQWIAFYRMF